MMEKTIVTTTDEWPYPGARWWKFDLHTHTPASVDYGKGSDQSALRKTEPREWLLDLMRADVDCVAVTDHNSSQWIEPLREGLAVLKEERPDGYRPLVLFPGVELTANGGVHILAIFDPETLASTVQSVIGAAGYEGAPGESSQACSQSPLEIIQTISDFGGIAIPAHADADDGLWQQPGNTREPILDLDETIAIEQSTPNLPSSLIGRPHPPAIVLGSDSHHPSASPSTKRPGIYFTWFKADIPNLVSFKMALLANDASAIRRSDELEPFNPFNLPDHFLESISVYGTRRLGRPDAVSANFSPRLNTIIGGRGSGKSSFIHALRFALDRGKELSILQDFMVPYQTYERFVKRYDSSRDEGVFADDTKITVTGWRNGVRYRIIANPDGVREIYEQDPEALDWLKAPEQYLTISRFPIQLLGQGQLASLSSDNQQLLLDLIDEAASTENAKTTFQSIKNEYEQLQIEIRQLSLKIDKLPETRQTQIDINVKLSRYSESQFISQAREAQEISEQDREIENKIKYVEDLADSIEEIAQDISFVELDEVSLVRSETSNATMQQSMARLASTVSSARERMESIVAELREIASATETEVQGSEWKAVGDQIIRRYQSIIIESKTDGELSLAEYDQLQRQKEEIEQRVRDLEETAARRHELIDEARKKRSEAIEARRAITQQRIKFLESEIADNQYVRISIVPYGIDLKAIADSLRTAMKITDGTFGEIFLETNMGEQLDTGLIVDLMSELPENSSERQVEIEKRLQELCDRIRKVCEGESHFGARFDQRLRRESENDQYYQSRVEMWFPEDGLEVQFNAGDKSTEWRSIRQASAGQRAAAMLAFLLSYGQEPLVIDQPEDDLDNRLVYDLVARQIRDRKSSRQVIIITHNANIVVHGDSDMIHAMQYRNGQCQILVEGSIHDRSVRDAVCNIMEGGKAAFARRYRRLLAGDTR